MFGLTLPTVHDNGTSRDALIRGFEAAYESVEAAYRAVKATAPNGRDYYPQGSDAMERATREHFDRLRRLDDVRDELAALAVHCEG